MSSGSPRVTVPDRQHVAAWAACGAALHGEVSRYADSSDEDGEWDSIGTGGVAAGMTGQEDLVAEDLEDENFSFFDAGLHGTGWSAADDRSLRSIGRAVGASNTESIAAAARVFASEPVAAPKPDVALPTKSESTPSAAAVAAAAARVRVAAASKVGAAAKIDTGTAPRRRGMATRSSKDLEERERRARAAEARLREQAEQQAKDQAELAAVQAKAARLRAVQQDQAATASVVQTNPGAAPAPAAVASSSAATAEQRPSINAAAAARSGGACPGSPDVGRRGDEQSTVVTPPRRHGAAKRGPSRPPVDSPLRTCAISHARTLQLLFIGVGMYGS